MLLRGGLHKRQAFSAQLLAAAVALLAPAIARAAEGMWTFDEFPTSAVQRTLGVKLDAPWLDHLRLGSVRLTTGCSAALVSPRGLLITNEHCVMPCLQALSDPSHDRLSDGFGLGEAEPPRACPGVQAEILVGIVDITSLVFDRSKGKTGAAFGETRERLLTQVERAVCQGDPRYRCQVIGFFGGGQFKVYKYRRYDDVRLEFAPEFSVAFFGGDAENFSYPRYALDVAALRLYERGRPASVKSWLSWSERAPIAGEAAFIAGNPGTTARQLTVSQLEALRDVSNPPLQAGYRRLRDRLLAYAAEGPAQSRAAAERLFNAENALKVIEGESETLHDPAFLAARRAEEATLKAEVAASPKLAQQVGDPWRSIDGLRKTYADQYPVWRALELGAGGGSRLFTFARGLVRAAAERRLASSDRLPEYADARLALVAKSLLDDQPVDVGVETVLLQAWLEEVRTNLGPGDPAASAMLGEASPADLARALATGTRLGDPAVRAALWRGGMAAILASDDPLIAYVRRTDPLARAARQVWEDDVLGPTTVAEERIAGARFALHGDGIYPDATFSPRVSFGRVEGWGQGEARVREFTTLGDLFGHATGAQPLRLPDSWLSAAGRLDKGAVLDFVTSNDIVGGSSGSPVVDAQGQVIGAAFDGNRASIAGAFAYDGAVNRTVVVSAAAIDEALAKVYRRRDLVAELLGDGRGRQTAAERPRPQAGPDTVALKTPSPSMASTSAAAANPQGPTLSPSAAASAIRSPVTSVQ